MSAIVGKPRELAIALLLLAGCGAPAPSPSPSPAASPIDSPATPPTPTANPLRTPAAQPTPVPLGTPKAAITDLAVAIQRVDSDLARHIEAFTSLGDQIVWSGGPRESDNNLYRYVLGSAAPELLFANSDPESILASVRGSAYGYLFTDERWVNGKRAGWRMWLLTGPGADPVLLDQSTDDRLIAPTIAMDDDWIAWEVVHGTIDDRLNELRAARVADPLHPLTLLSYSGRAVYLDSPSLFGDELWYGIADNDWVTNAEKPRVEMLDLSRPSDPPAVFGADQRAFMPAPGRDVVAWKSGGSDDLAAGNAGTLSLYWRDTAQIETLPVPGRADLAERISYPSVGNRFVAWWDDIRQRLYVYDLAERQFRRIAEYALSDDQILAKPSLSGDLLAFQHYTSDGKSYLEWVMLPD